MTKLDWRRTVAWMIAGALFGALGWAGHTAAQTQAASGPAAGPAVSTADAGSSRNVHAAGSMVRPAGPVAGDFIAFGGRVVADQPIAGDALLAGGSVDVRAPIGDDLRAGGGDVHIDSTIAGELYAAGGNVTLGPAARVARHASLAGGLVTIEGKVNGRLRVSAQRVVVNGEVGGDVRLFAQTVELGPQARLAGALHHVSQEFQRAEGSVVGGAVTREERPETRAEGRGERGAGPPWEGQWQSSGPSWVGMLMGFLGLLAAGAVFVLLFPRFSVEAPQTIRQSPWLAVAIGFGVLVGVPVLAVLLILTLLGIPLGIATFALYPLLLLLGYLAGVMFVAQRIRLAVGKSGANAFRTTMAYFALGLLVLLLIAQLPFVGSLTVIATVLFGIGACVLEWHRRRQEPTACASAPAPLAAPAPPTAFT